MAAGDGIRISGGGSGGVNLERLWDNLLHHTNPTTIQEFQRGLQMAVPGARTDFLMGGFGYSTASGQQMANMLRERAKQTGQQYRKPGLYRLANMIQSGNINWSEFSRFINQGTLSPLEAAGLLGQMPQVGGVVRGTFNPEWFNRPLTRNEAQGMVSNPAYWQLAAKARFSLPQENVGQLQRAIEDYYAGGRGAAFRPGVRSLLDMMVGSAPLTKQNVAAIANTGYTRGSLEWYLGRAASEHVAMGELSPRDVQDIIRRGAEGQFNRIGIAREMGFVPPAMARREASQAASLYARMQEENLRLPMYYRSEYMQPLSTMGAEWESLAMPATMSRARQFGGNFANRALISGKAGNLMPLLVGGEQAKTYEQEVKQEIETRRSQGKLSQEQLLVLQEILHTLQKGQEATTAAVKGRPLQALATAASSGNKGVMVSTLKRILPDFMAGTIDALAGPVGWGAAAVTGSIAARDLVMGGARTLYQAQSPWMQTLMSSAQIARQTGTNYVGLLDSFLTRPGYGYGFTPLALQGLGYSGAQALATYGQYGIAGNALADTTAILTASRMRGLAFGTNALAGIAQSGVVYGQASSGQLDAYFRKLQSVTETAVQHGVDASRAFQMFGNLQSSLAASGGLMPGQMGAMASFVAGMAGSGVPGLLSPNAPAQVMQGFQSFYGHPADNPAAAYLITRLLTSATGGAIPRSIAQLPKAIQSQINSLHGPAGATYRAGLTQMLSSGNWQGFLNAIGPNLTSNPANLRTLIRYVMSPASGLNEGGMGYQILQQSLGQSFSNTAGIISWAVSNQPLSAFPGGTSQMTGGKGATNIGSAYATTVRELTLDMSNSATSFRDLNAALVIAQQGLLHFNQLLSLGEPTVGGGAIARIGSSAAADVASLTHAVTHGAGNFITPVVHGGLARTAAGFSSGLSDWFANLETTAGKLFRGRSPYSIMTPITGGGNALGKWQINSNYLSGFANKYLGHDVTVQQLLNSPGDQAKIMQGIVMGLLGSEKGHGYNIAQLLTHASVAYLEGPSYATAGIGSLTGGALARAARSARMLEGEANQYNVEHHVNVRVSVLGPNATGSQVAAALSDPALERALEEKFGEWLKQKGFWSGLH